MKVKALRGVCIGIDRHMKIDAVEDLDPATGNYLVSIGAVVEVKDEPVQPNSQSPADDQQQSSDSDTQQPDDSSGAQSKKKK